MSQYREPSAFNIVSVPIYLLLLAATYGGWKYIPVYWQKQEIQEMMSEVLINANKVSNDALQATILTKLDKEFEIHNLPPENVAVWRNENWVDAKANYYTDVEHFGRMHHLELSAQVRRRIIDF